MASDRANSPAPLSPVVRALALLLGSAGLLAPAHAVMPSATAVVNFTGSLPEGGNGSRPTIGLFESTDGYLYSRTTYGGGYVNDSANGGTQAIMYRLRIDGTGFEALRDIDMDSVPTSTRWLGASDGYLYASSRLADSVVRYRFGDTAWSTFHSPLSTVSHMVEADGVFYTATNYSLGTLSTDGSVYTNLYTRLAASEGTRVTQIVRSADGRLYVMMAGLNASTAGTLFSIRPDGTDYQQIKKFDSGSGVVRFSTLITPFVEAGDGKLYGITTTKFYRVDKDGANYEELHTFATDNRGGINPRSLLLGQDGHIYGVTTDGGVDASGAASQGAIFRYRIADNIVEALYNFSAPTGPAQNTAWTNASGTSGVSTVNIGSNDAGMQPGTLMQASNGQIYGVAGLGGSHGWGTVFRFDPGDEVPEGSLLNDTPPTIPVFGFSSTGTTTSTSIGLGTSVRLYWRTGAVANCSASSTEPGSTWTGSQSTLNTTTGVTLTPTQVGNWTYTLTCVAQSPGYDPVSASVTVNVVPEEADRVQAGNGGGGALAGWLLAPLAGLGALALRRRRRMN